YLPPPSPTHTYTLSLHDALPISNATTGRQFQVARHQHRLLHSLPEINDRNFLARRKLSVRPAGSERKCNPRNEGISRSSYFESSDRKSTRLNSSHDQISYAVFCL